MGPASQLRRIAYLLERTHEPTYRVRAFRTAAATIAALPAARLNTGTLTELPGIGKTTAQVVGEALAGRTASYLQRLEDAYAPLVTGGAAMRAALRGDLHTHSDWSDGGSAIDEMADAAAELGHDYAALTDHSPRLTVANGLSPDRLRAQLAVVANVNARLAPFRLLTGIEVDILDDGQLDQDPELLAGLDVVVASVHSKLRMDGPAMTRRLVTAISNPHVDVLGHCTGRLVTGRGRPESSFDSELVFTACARFGVAVEINSRPERLDPPRRLLRQAIEAGCHFTIDTDAHAPGQLEWQPYGCARAEECGVPADAVINTWPLADLLDWTNR
jgi:putative hydrolase